MVECMCEGCRSSSRTRHDSEALVDEGNISFQGDNLELKHALKLMQEKVVYQVAREPVEVHDGKVLTQFGQVSKVSCHDAWHWTLQSLRL